MAKCTTVDCCEDSWKDRILAAEDVEAGQPVTPLTPGADGDRGLIGCPLVVVAVCLPFARCKTFLGGSVILDLRFVSLLLYSDEMLNAKERNALASMRAEVTDGAN